MSFGFSLADLRRHLGDDDEGEISVASGNGIGGTSADTDAPVPGGGGGGGMREVADNRRHRGDGGFAQSDQRRGESLRDFRKWQEAMQNARNADEVREINRRRAEGNYDFANLTPPQPNGVGETQVPNQNRDAISIENGVNIEDGDDDGSRGGGGGGGEEGGESPIRIEIDTNRIRIEFMMPNGKKYIGQADIPTDECSSDGETHDAYQPPGG